MPSVHQSVFVKPEHEFITLARWWEGPDNHRDPYVEVHIKVGDFQIVFYVDRAEAPKLALALNHLSRSLLKPDFGVWCLAPIEKVCPLCDQPSPHGEVHLACAHHEQSRADAAADVL